MTAIASLALAITAFASSTGALVAAEDVVVGEFASLTGPLATFGINSSRATKLAVSEINKAGGVMGGRKIQLILDDDQSKAGQPAAVVEKLIASDKVSVVIGEIASSLSLEAAPICQDNHIPMISPASTNPMVTQKGDYIFRVCFIDPFQGTVMAKFALDNLKLRKVAILTAVNQDYSIGLAHYFKSYALEHGAEIVSELSYSAGDRDFYAQLTAIREKKPEAIFVPGYYTEVGLIARQAKALGIKVPLLGGDGWDSPVLTQIAGHALDGAYFSTHFSVDDPSPVVQTFVKNYQEMFHDMPDAMSALGYDSILLLADALNRAKTTGEPALRDAIAATKGVAGVTGLLTLDENRNPRKQAVILRIEDKKFKFYTTIQP